MQTCQRSANPLDVRQRVSRTQMEIQQTIITTFEKCVLREITCFNFQNKGKRK